MGESKRRKVILGDKYGTKETSRGLPKKVELKPKRRQVHSTNKKAIKRTQRSLSNDAMNTVVQLLIELQTMSEQCQSYAQKRVVYLGENKPRVREIGVHLYQLGGEDLMFSVADQIPKYDQRELEFAWDGIGQWRA